MTVYTAFVPISDSPGGCVVSINGVTRKFAIPASHENLSPNACPEIPRSGQADVALVILSHHFGELDAPYLGRGDLYFLRRGYGWTGIELQSHKYWMAFVNDFLASNAGKIVQLKTWQIALWLASVDTSRRHLQASILYPEV